MAGVTGTTGATVPVTTLNAEVEAAKQAAQRVPSNTLDKDAFLQLLVAQLKYQDPSKPMDSSEFMTQNAQLTSVEKLSDLAEVTRSSFETQQKLSAAALVGRSITWKATDGTNQTGTVTAASIAGTNPSLIVSGQTVPLDSVISVTTSAA